MVKLFKQISIFDTYQECMDLSQNNKPKFLELLSQHLDLASLVPASFVWSYYRNLGRNRTYSLLSMLAALILQKILGIATISLLIIFLKLSSELREFCGFTDVPVDSQFTRFKQSYADHLKTMFDKMVDLTEPVCRQIDLESASTIAFDTSGIEAYVTENNPKFLNSIIRKLKVICKGTPEIDVYKMAYGLMPSCASANKNIKQLYINGYFCYVYKFAIITNGLGIVRNISFLDNDFKSGHPELKIDKKSDSPDEDKSIGDSSALKPVLNDFFDQHPNLEYDTFLGDSALDSFETYRFLIEDKKFKEVIIPINPRNSNPDIPPVEYNEDGWPLCPEDPSKPLKPMGWTREPGRSDRFKWCCPKAKNIKGKWITECADPCNGKTCGRVTYTSPYQDLRLYPGIIRGSEDWISKYNQRVVVEKNIQYFKDPMGCGDPKTRDNKTIKADLLLAGITQLITVIVADKLHEHKYIRSLKPLIA